MGVDWGQDASAQPNWKQIAQDQGCTSRCHVVTFLTRQYAAPIFFRLTENVPHFGYIPEYDMARFMEHRVIEATEYASHYRKKSDDKIARSITATRLGVPQVHGDAEDEEEEDLDVSGDEFCQHMIRRIEEVVG